MLLPNKIYQGFVEEKNESCESYPVVYSFTCFYRFSMRANDCDRRDLQTHVRDGHGRDSGVADAHGFSCPRDGCA